MQITYQEGTGALCGDWALDKELALLEEVGFEAVEIRSDRLTRYLTDHSIKELRDFFGSSRLRPICSGGTFLFPEMFLGKTPDEAEIDAQVVSRALASMDVAEKIGDSAYLVINHILNSSGSPFMQIDVLDQDYPYSRDQVTEFTARILKQFCKLADDHGLNIAFEPVCSRGGSVKTMEHALEIINATGCKNIGLCIDSFNQYTKDFDSDFSCYKVLPPEKIITAHINDADDLPPGVLSPMDRRFCGQGVIDLDNFMQNLKDIGYGGPISVEALQFEYYKQPLEWVIREAYRTTKELVDKYNNVIVE
jgi:2-keto-myo-inositol isomerase